ncbi:DnaJ domain-containing protein [Nodosilinea sp. LEGE 07088]|uniref:DnaJ domain-containing protein n=1 Tax=Nodosilinea sp. LEGE 07088 TaxID=2777968 RepID=UPI001880815C|nr:DnaJ domain-containing protein [Nodosilinea sp. LEGE 07088]MBE9139511.1 DnaJ domain-containing protein [Nodosilinea sp. LEGE 07088]
MTLAHHYRILGLRTGASFDNVKLAYRNLVRLYHPDVNPGDQLAKEKFIQVTQAYQALASALPPEMVAAHRVSSSTGTTKIAPDPKPDPMPTHQVSTQAAAHRFAPEVAKDTELPLNPTPGGSEVDQTLKVNSFKQLRDLLGSQRFPRAVALVEGLAQRFPEDPEIRQWHALTYYRWGHDLLSTDNLSKAAACLKKARRVDPYNKSLRQALQHDFQRLETLQRSSVPRAQ